VLTILPLLCLGKDTSLPPFVHGDNPDITDDRIAHILSEASQLLRAQNPADDTRSNEDSRSPAENRVEVRIISVIFLKIGLLLTL